MRQHEEVLPDQSKLNSKNLPITHVQPLPHIQATQQAPTNTRIEDKTNHSQEKQSHSAINVNTTTSNTLTTQETQNTSNATHQPKQPRRRYHPPRRHRGGHATTRRPTKSNQALRMEGEDIYNKGKKEDQ